MQRKSGLDTQLRAQCSASSRGPCVVSDEETAMPSSAYASPGALQYAAPRPQ